MYTYVCKYIYVYIYIYTHSHTHIYMYIYVVYTHTHIDQQIKTHKYIDTYLVGEEALTGSVAGGYT